jgi:processive 1,2-diacylglycerol beta-glucosyltransferase
MKVLIFSAIEGHASLAQALESFFKDKKIPVKDYCHEEPLLTFYRPFYRFAPSLMRYYYRLQSKKFFKKLFFKFTLLTRFKPTTKNLEAVKPDVAITTNWSFNQVLAKLKTKNKFTFVNLITDPRTFFQINVSDGADITCTFDDYQTREIKKAHPKLNVVQTGWFVKPEFEEKHDSKKTRKKLGLEDKLTLLFTTGWEGTEVVFKSIEAIAKLNRPLQIIVACGTNKNLLNRAKKLEESSKSSQTNIIPLPFTKELHLYMHSADLVIGKAGPNAVFETAATLTPFFATTHISGQEDGNLDIIEEYKLGFVEENPKKAFIKLVNIIENPKQLTAFQPHLKKMAQYNKKSKERLFKELTK